MSESAGGTIVRRLRALGDPVAAAGMARYGIRGGGVLGVSIPALRALARETGRDHALALALWASGLHEARILAAMVDDPRETTEAQLEAWVRDFDSWDLCDQCCNKLFDRTPWAWEKAMEWSGRAREFEKRAGFVMMAQLAVHDKRAPDRAFEPFFPRIEAEATDARLYVKKAVDWALRQLGKRNAALRARAVALAGRLGRADDRSARWIGRHAGRELARAGE